MFKKLSIKLVIATTITACTCFGFGRGIKNSSTSTQQPELSDNLTLLKTTENFSFGTNEDGAIWRINSEGQSIYLANKYCFDNPVCIAPIDDSGEKIILVTYENDGMEKPQASYYLCTINNYQSLVLTDEPTAKYKIQLVFTSPNCKFSVPVYLKKTIESFEENSCLTKDLCLNNISPIFNNVFGKISGFSETVLNKANQMKSQISSKVSNLINSLNKPTVDKDKKNN